MMVEHTGQELDSVEISGAPDRRTAEALRLEVTRLAKELGIELTRLRIEASPEASP
jgi:hypothetical protein